MSELLGIDCDQMRIWLCNRKIQSMREIITKPMIADQAICTRDALAKHIYSRLFNWIVSQINKSLALSDKIYRFIGVLDIYGFETFEINSFEQFCINYANEKLQQQFNLHVFKLEQEEYVKEKIEWKFIDFYDNQPCIDLIESKLGILDLLDEECKMPKGTDQTWCQKLYDCCKKWKHFDKPRLSNTAFIIKHFADDVKYECSGFLEKNRDTVMEEHINILTASHYELVAELFEEDKCNKKLKPASWSKSSAPSKSSQKQHKKTVGSQFRESLGLLMSTLNSTTPHYVRCIKPNDDKAQFNFESRRAVQQLRACGVLETVRISAAGFPSRWSYQDFLNRYRVLTRSKDIKRNDMKTTCKTILENIVKDEDKFQFGKTKIFFRAGQVAYLEKLRADKLRACAVMVQKHVRGFLQHNHYLQIKKAVIGIQCHGRGLLARRLAQFLRRTKAAIKIQKQIRCYIQRRKYVQLQLTVIGLQAHIRGMWGRIKYQEMRRKAAAIIIQKYVRRWSAYRKYKQTQKNIILVQSCIRRWFAKKELKRLKVEARSVEHIKNLNKGLENKIISLQQRIEELVKANKLLRAQEEESKNLANQAEQLKNLENILKMSNNKISDLQEEIISLRSELESTKIEKRDIIAEKDIIINEKNETIDQLKVNNKKLKDDLDRINEEIKTNVKNVQETNAIKLENEKRLLLEEFKSERTAYQKLLKEHARLEQRFENLQSEISRMKATSGHHRTPSNISLGSIKSDITEPSKDDDMQDEDAGYGTQRSKASLHEKLEDISWDHSPASKEDSPPDDNKPTENIDVSLVLKLQQKLKAIESEKAFLEKKLEHFEAKEEESPEERMPEEVIRLHQLEIENSKLKDDMNRLRKAMATEDSSNQINEIMDQFESLQEELERRREECLQLRTILANQSLDIKTVTRNAYNDNVELINEDGELLMAFETQKKLIRQLENELQAEKVKGHSIEQELRHEIKKLREDNERQQKLLSQNLKKSPQAQTEAILQHEINRLTDENVDLREKIDGNSDQVKKLKKQLKIYAKKLKDVGTGTTKKFSVISPHGTEQIPDITEDMKEQNENMPVVKHKDVEYMGILEYRKEDEAAIIKNLIYDFKPKIAVTLLPGLPAYILFMCIRHTDYINDDEKVRSLLNNTIQGIKRVIKKRHEDLEYTTMWLSNTCRLLHNLKQYSGDKAFQTENTPRQNEQCLRNFDLSEYRQVLNDVAVWIYQAVIKIQEERIQPLIVAAVLEHEAIPGISGNRPSGMRSRSSSVARELDSPIDPQRALDILIRELTTFFRILSIHAVDQELIFQVFKQLFYFICAGSLNNLLLRKDMCHWSKGMQIRYNLSHLEQWCRDQQMNQTEVTDILQPIIQASQLLQARKTDDDAQSICDMSNRLTTAQIIKILNLYTPADEFEERVPISFIRKMQACLQGRDKLREQEQEHRPNPAIDQGTLLMDTKFAFPIRFPFNPSSIMLEDIVVPDVLNLPMLKKI
ncbi:unconventional myosin-Va-like isoform X3 [Centruroides vittatus]